MVSKKSTDNCIRATPFLAAGAAFLVCFGLALTGFTQEPAAKAPVLVKIEDEKPIVIDASSTGPIDPQLHAQVSSQNGMTVNLRVNGKTMHLGVINTVLKIDGQVMQGGQFAARRLNQPLAAQPGKKGKTGFVSVYEFNKLQITQTVEVVATKPTKQGAKRRLDAALVQYLVENNDNKPRDVGVRVWMDMYLVNNDGAVFASPTTHPKRILDGIELKDKDVPDYLQVLQVPNLANPGYVAHFTYNLGRNLERPGRVVMTNLGGAFGNGWDMQIMQAMGDSAIGFFWDPKPLPPGKKRNLAYGYGEGICPNVESEGQFALALGGSFEPEKQFTITAYLHDAAPGQYMTLELPPGMERTDGRELQPVGAIDENGNAVISWKARVLQLGRFPVRVRSSAGVTQTKIITITRPGEKTAGS